MTKCKGTVLAVAWVALSATPVEAYIGPGAGAGTIAVVLGILASIAMAFLAIFWYPVKRLLRRKRDARQRVTAGKSEDVEDMDRS